MQFGLNILGSLLFGERCLPISCMNLIAMLVCVFMLYQVMVNQVMFLFLFSYFGVSVGLLNVIVSL